MADGHEESKLPQEQANNASLSVKKQRYASILPVFEMDHRMFKEPIIICSLCPGPKTVQIIEAEQSCKLLMAIRTQICKHYVR